jgi:hypothetical protein
MSGMDLVVRHPGGSLRDEGRQWLVAPRLATTAFWLPLAAGALLAAAALLHRPFVAFLLAEDSIFEWGTALALLATAALATVVARQLWRGGRRVQAVAYGVLCVACVLAAGEEISWGQRLLGLETPSSIAEANLQEEITVHNLGVVYPVYVATMLAVGLYGSLGSWLVHRVRAVRGLNWSLFVPPLFLAGAFLQLAIYRLLRYAGVDGHRYGECCEFFVAVAIAAFVGLNARRLRSEDRAGGPAL